ncbi:MAG: NUDIX domain-containing protein [Alphaproteobacteria bacterium]|jgi:ADP-ribose pyrophosphatase YjhB (NUDIX family)|nr:NUDIX domain-containing protein [Alphaproteobacteria bacterium]
MLLHSLHKIAYSLRNRLFGALGAKTVGARALVVQDEQVLFVKHTYQKGWYTIGGMVEKGETTTQAISRELFEEVGVTLKEAPELFGVYHSNQLKGDDYVAFYIVRKFDMKESASREIAEKKWFPLKSLPDDVTPATKRRVEEYLGTRAKTEKW